MQDAKVEVPSGDYKWFQTLMQQNGWTFEWVGEERPDFEEEDGK
jgi:hypothetical protein